MEYEDIYFEVGMKVNKAINFLAPYFGMSSEEAESHAMENGLEIFISGDVEKRSTDIPALYFMTNSSDDCSFHNSWMIFSCYGEGKEDYAVSHEVGHWFHYIVNPNLVKDHYLPENQYIFSHANREGIAHLAAVTFTLGDQIVKDSDRFSISGLARMDLNEIMNNWDSIKDFYRNILPFIILPSRYVFGSLLGRV